MLVNPAFASSLGIPQCAQTLAFVKNVMSGLSYVDIQVSGSTLTCQVKTGDGQNKVGVSDIMIRLAADLGIAVPPALPLAPFVGASVGIIKAGFGTNLLWLQTNSAGAFTIVVTWSGNILVELTPAQGIPMVATFG